MEFDDQTTCEAIDLDALDDATFKLPEKIGRLIRKIDRRRCQAVQVQRYATGEWYVVWEERHPELPSPEEFLGETYWMDRRTRRKWRQLQESLPSVEHDMPLMPREALALAAACWLPEAFAEEIEALI